MTQSSQPSKHSKPGRIRVVLAKVGLDGHDRGIKVVARSLRDAGMEVIYTGLWQSPEAVVRSAVQEDAGFLGLSFLSGSHTALMPKVFDALRAAGAAGDIDVIVGGIVPQDDYTMLEKLGVARVFGPGSGLADIVSFIQQRWARRTGESTVAR
ncbi:MAG: cobalamin B12-binding domain-containing protein [Phycisphaerae bacterium]|nr:cobalamin B12-binding domain-containing protein [Phycisphaerae bacterium]